MGGIRHRKRPLLNIGPANQAMAPLADSVPFQRKPLLILSTFFNSHLGGAKAERKYTGMDDRTEFSSFKRLARFRNLPCQAGSLFDILSISG
jgi:hypothetical protein